jgi:hypothetical protein
MRQLLVLVLLIAFLISGCSPHIPSKLNSSILTKSKILPNTGVLKEKKGYIYLKLNDNYIHCLYPIIKNFDNKAQKPPYFRTLEVVGAHISVIYEEELKNFKIIETGKNFIFSPVELKLVRSKNIDYYVLQVESRELENLRTKYNLSKLLKGRKFHITLAIGEKGCCK